MTDISYNDVYSFEVEGKVKAKQSTRFTKIGDFVRTYTPADVKSYANWVKLCFKQAYPVFLPLEGALWLQIDVYFSIPKSYTKKKREAIANNQLFPTVKPDCDNICKQIADSLNGLAWLDDKQIIHLGVFKKYTEGVDKVVVQFGEEVGIPF